jgi:integration host factor subunit alpha
METVTKAMIIESLQQRIGFSKKSSADLIEKLLEIIKTNLANDEDIMLTGFGKFMVKSKEMRKGRNPATGEDMMLPSRKVVTFKCSGRLRDRIARKKRAKR